MSSLSSLAVSPVLAGVVLVAIIPAFQWEPSSEPFGSKIYTSFMFPNTVLVFTCERAHCNEIIGGRDYSNLRVGTISLNARSNQECILIEHVLIESVNRDVFYLRAGSIRG